jgi:hypothetical protein
VVALQHGFGCPGCTRRPSGAPGESSDFPALVRGIAAGDPSQGSSRLARALWITRWRVGELLGWVEAQAGLGGRVPTLRGRPPDDLLGAPGPAFDALPFSSLYMLDDEFAAEIANRTVHGVPHLGWLQDGTGGYRGQMAVLVKPNGALGTGYLAAITPFRHLIVYPAMLREIEKQWRARRVSHPVASRSQSRHRGRGRVAGLERDQVRATAAN